jgi:hypothetical protein
MHLKVDLDPPFWSAKIGRSKLSPVSVEQRPNGATFVCSPFSSDRDALVLVDRETMVLESYPRHGRLEDIRGARIFCGSVDCGRDLRTGRSGRARLVGVVFALDLPTPVAFVARLPQFAETQRPVHIGRRLREEAGLDIRELPADVRCFRCGTSGAVRGLVEVD